MHILGLLTYNAPCNKSGSYVPKVGGVCVGLDKAGLSRQTDASSSSGNSSQGNGLHRFWISTVEISCQYSLSYQTYIVVQIYLNWSGKYTRCIKNLLFVTNMWLNMAHFPSILIQLEHSPVTWCLCLPLRAEWTTFWLSNTEGWSQIVIRLMRVLKQKRKRSQRKLLMNLRTVIGLTRRNSLGYTRYVFAWSPIANWANHVSFYPRGASSARVIAFIACHTPVLYQNG